MSAIASGASVLGERFLVLGRGPASVPGGAGAAVGMAADGDLVLIVAMHHFPPDAAAGIADRLDELASVGMELQAVSDHLLSLEQLSEEHRHFFHTQESSSTLNSEQRVVLLVDEPPSSKAWKALVIELGNRLGGVWEVREGVAEPLSPPDDLLRGKVRSGGLPWPTAMGICVLAGVAIGAVGLFRGEGEAIRRSDPVVKLRVREVALGVTGDATHSQWIGQQRLLRTSDGRLVVLYPGPNGLQLVTDRNDQGRTWRSPIAFPHIQPSSLSVAIGDNDDIHIAFVDVAGVSYARLRSAGQGWEEPVVLPLDPGSTSPVVDIAWDPSAGSAYAVWAGSSAEGETPRWAAISAGKDPHLVRSGDIAGAGEEISVLVNVAVGPDSTLHTTYRRGDSPFGWFARSGQIGSDGTVEWGVEERLPSDEGFGAAALAVDGDGVAHLVLRDSTTFKLIYLRRHEQRGWSSPQSAVQARSIEQIDLPMLTVDSTSRLIYLFFQTNEFNAAGEVSMAVRHPDTGWDGPYRIAPTEEGATFPTGMSVAAGHPIALWTKGGDAPSIQAARVIAP